MNQSSRQLRRLVCVLIGNPFLDDSTKSRLTQEHFSTPYFPGVEAFVSSNDYDRERTVMRWLHAGKVTIDQMVKLFEDHPGLISSSVLDAVHALHPEAIEAFVQRMASTCADHDVARNLQSVSFDLPTSTLSKLAAVCDWHVLKHAACPPELVEEGAGHPDEYRQRLAAAHPSVSLATLERLMRSSHAEVRSAALRNPRAPVDWLAKSKSRSPEIRAAIAGNPSCPRDVLLRLSRSRDVDVRKAVFTNPVWSDDDIADLLDQEPSLAGFTKDAARILTASQSRDATTRRYAALNEKATADILVRLSNDKAPEVRAAVAENPRTPWIVLERLASDPDALVRWTLVDNPQLVTEPDRLQLFERMAVDTSHLVRRGVMYRLAQRYSKPVERQIFHALLTRFTQDQDEEVRDDAAEMLEHIQGGEEPFGDGGWGGFSCGSFDETHSSAPPLGLLERPQLSESLLNLLVNLGLPPDTLAAHPSLTPALAERLFREGDFGCRREIYARFPFNEERLLKFAQGDMDHDDLLQFSLRLARDPATDVRVLRVLAGHTYGGVRSEVAQHPNVSPDILTQLVFDSDHQVSGAALMNARTPLEQKIRAVCRPSEDPLDMAIVVYGATLSAELLDVFCSYLLSNSTDSAVLDAHEYNAKNLLLQPKLPLQYIEPLKALAKNALARRPVSHEEIILFNEHGPAAPRRKILSKLLTEDALSQATRLAEFTASPELLEDLCNFVSSRR